MLSSKRMATKTPSGALLVAPTEEQWKAMSPAARERLLEEILDALDDPASSRFKWRPDKIAMDRIDQLKRRKKELENQVEAAQLELERVRGQAIAGLKQALLAALEARSIPCPAPLRARVDACDDPAVLQGWLLRALAASTIDAIFGPE